MKVPIPCSFGESAECEGKVLPFVGVSWFKWSSGMEYTYTFLTGHECNKYTFYYSSGDEHSKYITIPDKLLIDGPLKEKEFPFRGRGYAYGIDYINGKMYIDFILTDNYFSHIEAECDERFEYIPNGNIIFPPSWDTEEKKEKALLKSIKFNNRPPLKVKASEPQQLSIFDFIKN